MEKSTLHLKQYFIVETSEIKSLENPFFLSEKYRFVVKIQILSPKTRFSHGKEYITSEIVFYSRNLRDKKVQKIRFFTAKNTVLSLKYKFQHRKRCFLMEKSTLHLKQYFIVETSVFLDKNVQKIRFFPAKIPFCR